jgi:uncharacterized membrane protein
MNNFGWLLLAVAAVAVSVSIWLNLRAEQRKARLRRATESTVPTRKLAHEKPGH